MYKCIIFRKKVYNSSKNSEKKGYVYLLGDFGKEGVFKIGVTRGTIERRIKKLQTGNSGEIYIVDYFQTEHPFFIEKWMHIQYCGKQVLNEWFEMGIEDMKNFRKNCKKFEDLYNVSHSKNIDLDGFTIN